ncbi:MAG: DUF2147 domain-containing protein [Pseudomonadota bacterium]
MRIFSIPTLFLGLLTATQATAANDVFGRWVVENGKAVIELYPCAENACGRLVWLQNPFMPNGQPKRDEKNQDPALVHRPICGLQLVSGLRPDGDGAWQDGEIYSTRHGKSFGLELRPAGSDVLKVRGYLGFSLFGSTQTWERDDGIRGNCVQLRKPGQDR